MGVETADADVCDTTRESREISPLSEARLSDLDPVIIILNTCPLVFCRARSAILAPRLTLEYFGLASAEAEADDDMDESRSEDFFRAAAVAAAFRISKRFVSVRFVSVELRSLSVSVDERFVCCSSLLLLVVSFLRKNSNAMPPVATRCSMPFSFVVVVVVELRLLFIPKSTVARVDIDGSMSPGAVSVGITQA